MGLLRGTRVIFNKLYRDIKSGLAEITFQLTIDANILKKPVSYKYVIFSPKTKGDKDMPYELIPNAGYQRDPNRALCISNKKWEQCCGGELLRTPAITLCIYYFPSYVDLIYMMTGNNNNNTYVFVGNHYMYIHVCLNNINSGSLIIVKNHYKL